MLLLPLVILPVILAEQSKIKCPDHCECDLDLKQVTCSTQLLLSLPDTIPPAFNVLTIRNALIRSIPKTAFRRMEHLREFRMENCPELINIEKFAFKGLKKLRHAANIRELSISGSDLALSRHAFASITQLDFLTVSGVSLIEPQLFSNSTRFHIVHFKDSSFEIPPRAFEDLAHVHQFLIQRSRLPVIAEDAFTGLQTVETVELFDNQIGKLSPRAFIGIENVGRVRIARNSIHTFDSPEAILSTAVQMRVEENTLDCTCSLKWMPSHSDRRLVDVNYCGAAAVYRSVRSYLKQHCESGHQVQRSVNSEQQHAASNHDRLLPSFSASTSFLLLVSSFYYLLFLF